MNFMLSASRTWYIEWNKQGRFIVKLLSCAESAMFHTRKVTQSAHKCTNKPFRCKIKSQAKQIPSRRAKKTRKWHSGEHHKALRSSLDYRSLWACLQELLLAIYCFTANVPTRQHACWRTAHRWWSGKLYCCLGDTHTLTIMPCWKHGSRPAPHWAAPDKASVFSRAYFFFGWCKLN